jgi:ankyrin repeat protein
MIKQLCTLLTLLSALQLSAASSSASVSTSASASAMDIDDRADERAADQKRAYAAASAHQRPDLFAILERYHIHNKFCTNQSPLTPPGDAFGDAWKTKDTFPDRVEPGLCIFDKLHTYLDEPCSFPTSYFGLKTNAEGLCREFAIALQNGADPNQKNAAGTPILSAISQVLIPELKELLIKSGADINLPDNESNTPLFYMLTLDLDDAEHLYSKSDFDSVVTSLRKQGMAVFNPTAYNLRPAALRFLIASGANVHHTNSSGSTIFGHLMTSNSIYQNTVDDIEFLINHGAETPTDDTHEKLLKNALFMICERDFFENSSDSADFDLIKILISYGIGSTGASLEEDEKRLTKILFEKIPDCLCDAGTCNKDDGAGLCDRDTIEADISMAVKEGLKLYRQRLGIQYKLLDRAVRQLGLGNKLIPTSSSHTKQGAPSIVETINEYTGVFLPLEKEGSHEDTSWQDFVKDDHVHAMEAQMKAQTAASSAASASASAASSSASSASATNRVRAPASSAASQTPPAAGAAAMQVDEDPNDDVRGLPKCTKRKAPEANAPLSAASSSANTSASAMDIDEGEMKSSASSSASAASSSASAANATEETGNEGPATKKPRTK